MTTERLNLIAFNSEAAIRWKERIAAERRATEDMDPNYVISMSKENGGKTSFTGRVFITLPCIVVLFDSPPRNWPESMNFYSILEMEKKVKNSGLIMGYRKMNIEQCEGQLI
jgi:hypothetical protein